MNAHIVGRGPKDKRSGKKTAPFTIVLDFGRDENGKRIQDWKHSGYPTKKAAQEDMIRILRELQTGEYIEPTKLTVAEWLDRWMKHYSVHLGRHTKANYEIVVRVVKEDIGHMPLRAVKTDTIQALYTKWQEAGLAASTIGTRHGALHGMFERAVKAGVLGRNPVTGVVKPKEEQKDVRAFTQDELDRLLRESQGTLQYLPALISAYTGMRLGEVLGLKWDRVDFKEQTIQVVASVEQTKPLTLKQPKTKDSIRLLMAPKFVFTALEQHRKEQAAVRLRLGTQWQDLNLVCPSDTGGIRNPTALSRQFTRLCQRCGVEGGHFHCLRHTYATRLLERGIPIKVVQEQMGHSTITMTGDTYSHVTRGMQEQAVAVLEELQPTEMQKVVEMR